MPATLQKADAAVVVRKARPDDAQECGRICFEAFAKINKDHGFPPDFPSPEVAIEVLSRLFSQHSGFYCVVAEVEGRVMGSNCLDERSTIAGVGPITVDPGVQNHGIGRKLMVAVMDRARERGVPGIRLLQSTFHNRSLSLYTKLGFHPRELAVVMQGSPARTEAAGYSVRPAKASDLEACNRVCEAVHGHNRSRDVNDSIAQGSAVVVEHHGGITGYASLLGFFGHAVAETNLDLQALIASASSFAGPGIIVPTRNAQLFRWCLENGLRVVEPLTLMTIGLYNEPEGAYLPSILY
jgi:GNAT superfamily N-acetyltransferase